MIHFHVHHDHVYHDYHEDQVPKSINKISCEFQSFNKRYNIQKELNETLYHQKVSRQQEP